LFVCDWAKAVAPVRTHNATAETQPTNRRNVFVFIGTRFITSVAAALIEKTFTNIDAGDAAQRI
jgi:hypothetical protein